MTTINILQTPITKHRMSEIAEELLKNKEMLQEISAPVLKYN